MQAQISQEAPADEQGPELFASPDDESGRTGALIGREADSERGLTLVELIVVIVLIGLIATVVMKNVLDTGEAQKAELNVTRMRKLQQSLGQYRLKYNSLPSSLQDLVKPSPEVKEQGTLFTSLASEAELNDIWGTPYRYTTGNNKRTYTLGSLGADGIEGGEGPNQDVTISGP